MTIEEYYANDPEVLARITKLKPLAEQGNLAARYELVGWASLAAFDLTHEEIINEQRNIRMEPPTGM